MVRLVSREVDDAKDEKKHVSKVQVELDGIFYSGVTAVARRCVCWR